MQNILYVAEKANAGKDIARVLGLTGKTKEGFYAGEFTDKRIIVAWASGHYITLKEPEDIDEKYAKWTVEDLPITFDLRFGLKVVPGKEKAFSVLTDYLQAADLIVNCGDAGREGELIQRWIYKMAGVRSKPVKRLWTSSLTDKGIREANNDLHDSSEYDNLCLMFGGFEKYIRAAPLVEIPSRYFKEDTGEHHALLPEDGDISEKYEKLNEKERLVLDAIARRFISLFYPPQIHEKITVDLMDREYLFIAKGKKVIDEGFKVLCPEQPDRKDEEEDKEETSRIPDVSVGDLLPAEYELKEDTTKPKKRYTESSLLTLMDINGIGTAATRSGLITELTKPKGKNKELYAEKKKNCFYSTKLGRSIIKVVPEYMSNLDFLAAMDKKIKAVAKGEMSREDVIRQLELELEENLKLMKLSTGKKELISKKPAQKESGYKCPLCGRMLYEYDKGFGCSGYNEKVCSFFLHKVKRRQKNNANSNIKASQ